jgi:hypothetical protein
VSAHHTAFVQLRSKLIEGSSLAGIQDHDLEEDVVLGYKMGDGRLTTEKWI